MPDSIRRRSFLGTGAAAAASFIASEADAAPRISYKRQTAASPDLLKVGVVLGRHRSHTNVIWHRFTNPPPGSARRTGMIITHFWTNWDDTAEEFATKTGAQRVKKLDGMIGKVDGVIIDEAHATTLQHPAAIPYIETGIPTFVNRPFSSSMRNAKKMVDIARKNETPLMSGSSFEYIKEAGAAKHFVQRDKLKAYEVINGSDDYYTHGLHGMWFAYACVGGGVKRISTLSQKWWKGPALTSIEHKPREKNGEPVYGIVRHGITTGGYCGIRVYGPDYREFISGPDGQGWVVDQGLWAPMLIAMEQMFMTGKQPESYDDILEKTKIFLASFRSVLELNGSIVELDSFDDNWDAGPMRPEHYPESSYTSDELKVYEKVLKG